MYRFWYATKIDKLRTQKHVLQNNGSGVCWQDKIPGKYFFQQLAKLIFNKNISRFLFLSRTKLIRHAVETQQIETVSEQRHSWTRQMLMFKSFYYFHTKMKIIYDVILKYNMYPSMRAPYKYSSQNSFFYACFFEFILIATSEFRGVRNSLA